MSRNPWHLFLVFTAILSWLVLLLSVYLKERWLGAISFVLALPYSLLASLGYHQIAWLLIPLAHVVAIVKHLDRRIVFACIIVALFGWTIALGWWLWIFTFYPESFTGPSPPPR
jgi:hypothetical protein